MHIYIFDHVTAVLSPDSIAQIDHAIILQQMSIINQSMNTNEIPKLFHLVNQSSSSSTTTPPQQASKLSSPALHH